jgi:hypothetical protein
MVKTKRATPTTNRSGRVEKSKKTVSAWKKTGETIVLMKPA